MATLVFVPFVSLGAQSTQRGPIGLEGRVPAEPPKNAPTITFPKDGSTITELPVTVRGLCQSGLLVKVFKNNIFGGSAVCKNNNYAITIDLFIGLNELVARQYDDLDQASPDSNRVRVTFPAGQFATANRISLSSNYAKRGANPGEELTWPIILSGGVGPYAISVDWGDGTDPDIISRELAGTFDITHVYENAGTYNILIRATDKNGDLAFLQLVGVGNGELAQDGQAGTGAPTEPVYVILWWPIILLAALVPISFWLGKRHQIHVLRRRLSKRDTFTS